MGPSLAIKRARRGLCGAGTGIVSKARAVVELFNCKFFIHCCWSKPACPWRVLLLVWLAVMFIALKVEA